MIDIMRTPVEFPKSESKNLVIRFTMKATDLYICEKIRGFKDDKICLYEKETKVYAMDRALEYCLKPDAPLNGYVNISTASNNSLSIATFACNVNYKLIGLVSNDCKRNETWKFKQVPECVRVCNTKILENYGTIDGDYKDAVVGKTIHLACHNGAPIATLTCAANGSWTNVDTICMQTGSEITARETATLNMSYVILIIGFGVIIAISLVMCICCYFIRKSQVMPVITVQSSVQETSDLPFDAQRIGFDNEYATVDEVAKRYLAGQLGERNIENNYDRLSVVPESHELEENAIYGGSSEIHIDLL